LLLAAACSGQTLRIGSKRFTESYLLGEIVTQAAKTAGEGGVIHQRGLGNTAIVFNALQTGAVDVYPDYTGTIAREILKLDRVPPLEDLNRALIPMGIGIAVPLGFNNTYALAMRAGDAEQKAIHRLSDLAAHGELRLGLSPEFIGRADGWEGLKGAYQLPFATPRGLDHGLAYEALAARQVDLIDIYSTDAKIARYGLTVLDDDRHYFPPYEAVLLYRLDVPQRFPRAWKALTALQNRIGAQEMIRMNAAAELDGRSFSDIAAAFLAGSDSKPQARVSFWWRLFGPDFTRLCAEHLLLVFASLAASVLVGVPLGIAAQRRPSFGAWILGATGVVQTIPSLALLAFLIPLLGRIGVVPALIALGLYALLPIVRNTYTGLAQVAPGLKEAGLALGLDRRTVLTKIELPLALPTVLAGIKTAAVINVGTATIAAFIGAGGFGERIATGLALNDNALLLAGAIPAAALALAVQWAFDWFERCVTPDALRITGRT
jgi:osmoprotectant transport system permease protein